MSIDVNNFQMKNSSITDNGTGWESFLREIFISDPSYADKYRSLAGTIRLPVILDGDTRPRTKVVNNKDPKCISERAGKMMLFNNYLKEKNLKGTDFRYLEIIYTGPRKDGWYEYDNTLAKFIDYVLPLLKEKVSDVSIDNVVFTEHASPEKEPVSIHILYTSAEPCEFAAIWNLYLNFLEQRENKEVEKTVNKSAQPKEQNINTVETKPIQKEPVQEEKEPDNNKQLRQENIETQIAIQETANEEIKEKSIEKEQDISDFVPSVDDLPNEEDLNSEEPIYDLEEQSQSFDDVNLEPTEEEYADENDD